jgi:hypothetical protein
MDYQLAFPIIKENIPNSRLGYNSNNVYVGFPPLMSDGRTVIASFQPDAVLNEQWIADKGIQSNWQYRQYLQKNAAEILQKNMMDASNDCGYFDRYADYKFNNGTPVLFQSFMDNRKPIFYSDTDLKQMYLTRQQLDAMKMAPIVDLNI